MVQPTQICCFISHVYYYHRFIKTGSGETGTQDSRMRPRTRDPPEKINKTNKKKTSPILESQVPVSPLPELKPGFLDLANWPLSTILRLLLRSLGFSNMCTDLINNGSFFFFFNRPETVNSNGGFTFNANWPGVWVQIVSSWLCLALYLWTLIAPIACPNRQFGFAGGEA